MLAEVINAIYNSDITEDVLDRLEAIGYTPDETEDAYLIAFAIKETEISICNNCNLTEIPSGLEPYAVDSVCGEVLGIKRATGKLNDFNIQSALQAVKLGDINVTFNGTSTDTAKLLDALINSLKNIPEGQLACYRRIRW